MNRAGAPRPETSWVTGCQVHPLRNDEDSRSESVAAYASSLTVYWCDLWGYVAEEERSEVPWGAGTVLQEARGIWEKTCCQTCPKNLTRRWKNKVGLAHPSIRLFKDTLFKDTLLLLVPTHSEIHYFYMPCGKILHQAAHKESPRFWCRQTYKKSFIITWRWYNAQTLSCTPQMLPVL